MFEVASQKGGRMSVDRLWFRELVLDAIANDFEDLETIYSDVSVWCAREGLVVNLDEVVDALRELVELGYAKAYWLSEFSPPVECPVDTPGCYFLVTAKGKEIVVENMRKEDLKEL
jgi:hypothetical protein